MGAALLAMSLTACGAGEAEDVSIMQDEAVSDESASDTAVKAVLRESEEGDDGQDPIADEDGLDEGLDEDEESRSVAIGEKSSSAGMSATGIAEVSVSGVTVYASMSEDEDGGTTIYVLGNNPTSKDKTVLVSIQAMKDGDVVESFSRYVEMEAGCFDADFAYTAESIDDVEIEAEESSTNYNLLGGGCSVDYEIDGASGTVSGTVRNGTGSSLSFPCVKMIVLDEDMRVVYFSSTYADDEVLFDGMSSSFSMNIDFDGEGSQYCFFVTATEAK